MDRVEILELERKHNEQKVQQAIKTAQRKIKEDTFNAQVSILCTQLTLAGLGATIL